MLRVKTDRINRNKGVIYMANNNCNKKFSCNWILITVKNKTTLNYFEYFSIEAYLNGGN